MSDGMKLYDLPTSTRCGRLHLNYLNQIATFAGQHEFSQQKFSSQTALLAWNFQQT